MAEKENGFSSFYKLIKANRNSTFIITFASGDSFEVKYDSEFEDDGNNTDGEPLLDQTFNTIVMTIEKVLVKKSERYKVGHIILINPLNMPYYYRIKD